MNNINSQIINILSHELGMPANKITNESDLVDDLGADSIDTINIIATISTEFNINIPMQHATEVSSVGELIRLVEEIQK